MKIARKPQNKDNFTKYKLYNFHSIPSCTYEGDETTVSEVAMYLDQTTTGEEIFVKINRREYEKLKAKFEGKLKQ